MGFSWTLVLRSAVHKCGFDSGGRGFSLHLGTHCAALAAVVAPAARGFHLRLNPFRFSSPGSARSERSFFSPFVPTVK